MMQLFSGMCSSLNIKFPVMSVTVTSCCVSCTMSQSAGNVVMKHSSLDEVFTDISVRALLTVVNKQSSHLATKKSLLNFDPRIVLL